MPLQTPQASQARCSSSTAFAGEGAPSRTGNDRSPATARRMLTPHRATSSCVGRLVAKIDARAKRTAGASARSEGKGRSFAVASGMDPTRRCDSARVGRTVNTFREVGSTDVFAIGAGLSGRMSKTLTRMAAPTRCTSEHRSSHNLKRQDFAVSASLVKKAWRTSFTSEWVSVAVPAFSRASMSSTWPFTFNAAVARRAFGSARIMLSANAVATPIAISSFSGLSLMAPLIGSQGAIIHGLKVAVHSEWQLTRENILTCRPVPGSATVLAGAF